MEIENNVIVYYSGGLMYEREERGVKNNAVQVITSKEEVQIQKTKPKDICVVDKDIKESFTRSITDISIVGTIEGVFIIVITWKVEP